MSVQRILIGGIALGVALYLITFALHLLNRPSDLAVAGGYLLLVLLFAGAVGAVRRVKRTRAGGPRPE
jgi:hypothetical protein